MARQFVKALSSVQTVIQSKSHQEASDSFDKLMLVRNADNSVSTAPALNAIVEVFQSVCHMQTAMEARTYPTLHKLLPMLTDMKEQISSLCEKSVHATSQVSQSAYTKRLAKHVKQELDQIEIHDLWTVALK